jgi:hypothetical protein
VGAVLLYRFSVFQEEKRAGKKAFHAFYFILLMLQAARWASLAIVL